MKKSRPTPAEMMVPPAPDPQLSALVQSLQSQANNLGISLANLRLDYLRGEAGIVQQIQQLGQQIETINKQISEKMK